MVEPEFHPTDTEIFGSSGRYRYSQRDFIARGSSGGVYKARTTESESYAEINEVVAVKRVHLDKEVVFLANSSMREALLLRWEKVLDLKHSHLLAYYKASLVRTPRGISVEFAMDYYEEGDLAALLSSSKLKVEKPPFAQEAVICFALQLADGLTYLHNNSIIHGDIKPGNILVRSTDMKHRKLVLGDLDDYVQMPADTTSAADTSPFHGTVRYMSPEMLRMCLNEATNDNTGCKTNVWSLGCVILDLANHSVGITDKCLCKETRVQAAENLTDCRFAGLISEGWVPFVAESIPVSVAACIHECLRPDYTCRISAKKLVEKLRDTAKDLSKLSRASEPVDRECFCSYA